MIDVTVWRSRARAWAWLGVCAITFAAGRAQESTKRVAVLPFEGPSAGEVQAVIGSSLSGERTIVPADQVAKAVRAVGRNDTSPEAFAAVARRLNAGAIVDGRVLKDDRWRYQSLSRITRFYGDLGWKGSDSEVQLVASRSTNFFGVLHP